MHSYLAAKLFDAHLGDAILNLHIVAGSALHQATWMWSVAPIAIPLMILAAVATHLTARSVARHSRASVAAASGRSELMTRLSLYVFPAGVLVFGAALPVGLLIYWVSNNVWTFGQQHLVLGRIAARAAADAAAETAAAEHREAQARRALAPPPGRKPVRAKAVARKRAGASRARPGTAGGRADGGDRA